MSIMEIYSAYGSNYEYYAIDAEGRCWSFYIDNSWRLIDGEGIVYCSDIEEAGIVEVIVDEDDNSVEIRLASNPM